MPIREYNVVDEPFVSVRMTGGEAAELSLLDTFRQASDVHALGGELPTHVFAQLRLLLAILLRSVERDDHADRDEEPGDRWLTLWRSDSLPLEAIESYLATFHDRFDLLDPERPFLQVPGLRTTASTKGGVGLQRLVPDVSSNGLFAMRRAGGLARLSYAEAARQLLHAHAYAVSGIYPAGSDDLSEDPRAKGGKIYPLGVGPAGDLGGVIIEGRDLRETLLLNLVLGSAASETITREPISYEEGDDAPVWERDPLTAAPERRPRPGPRGQADLFTWPSRRIRLIHDGQGVTGAVLCYGDPLGPQNLHTVETMSAFHRNDAQTRKAGRTVYMPVRHRPSRALWRGLAAILPQDVPSRETLQPATIRWLGELAERGRIPDIVLRTRAIGVEYGTQSSVIDEVIDDAVDIHLALLQEQHRELAHTAIEIASRTEDAVRALGRLAENLTLASGGDRDIAASSRDSETAEGYALMERPFRDWLAGLDGGTDPDDARGDWAGMARDILRRRAEWLVQDAGTPAWIGRAHKQNGSDALNSSKAFLWFLRALGNALPAPNAPRADGPTPSRRAPGPDENEEIA